MSNETQPEAVKMTPEEDEALRCMARYLCEGLRGAVVIHLGDDPNIERVMLAYLKAAFELGRRGKSPEKG